MKSFKDTNIYKEDIGQFNQLYMNEEIQQYNEKITMELFLRCWKNTEKLNKRVYELDK